MTQFMQAATTLTNYIDRRRRNLTPNEDNLTNFSLQDLRLEIFLEMVFVSIKSHLLKGWLL